VEGVEVETDARVGFSRSTGEGARCELEEEGVMVDGRAMEG